MVATESQIATMRQGFMEGVKPSDVAEIINISVKTVKRYYKKFEEDRTDKTELTPCARDLKTDSVRTWTNGTIHTISKETTISQLCRRLEETEGLYKKAIIDSVTDPTLSYLIVKHNETMLDIIKEMGKYCGLSKGNMLDVNDRTIEIRVRKV